MAYFVGLSFAPYDVWRIGQDIEDSCPSELYVLVLDQEAIVQYQIVASGLNHVPQGFEGCQGGERTIDQKRQNPRSLGIALDYREGGLINHIIHVGVREEATQGGENGLRHDRIANMDEVGNDKEAAKGPDAPDDAPIVVSEKRG